MIPNGWLYLFLAVLCLDLLLEQVPEHQASAEKRRARRGTAHAHCPALLPDYHRGKQVEHHLFN